LSKGDYLITATAHRKNLLNTNKNIRDYRWKRLFRLAPLGATDQEYNEWKNKRFFVKEVFDDPNFKTDRLKESLKKICKTLPNDWRKYFIDNPEMIKYCQQGFIRVEAESQILLFKESQLNHYHREMYSYHLYCNIAANTDLILPFKSTVHYEVMGGDEVSCALIDDWCNERKNYGIEVNCSNLSGFLKYPYEIKFSKTKGNTDKVNYSNAIITILESLNFEYCDEPAGFWISAKSEEKVIMIIKTLCSQLNAL